MYLVLQTNEFKTSAYISGHIKISYSITLKNVYYISNFHVNCISATKLISSLNFHLIFKTNVYLILQNLNLKLIGTIRRHGDLSIPQADMTANSGSKLSNSHNT